MTPRGPWVGCTDERAARAHLSRVVEPGDSRLGDWLSRRGWSATIAALAAGAAPEAWQARQATLGAGTPALLGSSERAGIRLVVPDDDDWPAGLDDLADIGAGTPACLWVRGPLPVEPAAALVGSRACTAYGEHVAMELAAGLVDRGWCVVSGAAYGIDAAAHRGAVTGSADPAGCPSVAVLACGVDTVHPIGNADLVGRLLGAGGAVVSELPPGARPTKWRFLARNRLIAAMTAGTVVVEAARRSGALRTARVAGELGRYVAAVPGPVTSAASVGCHDLFRDVQATCVSTAEQVAELFAPLGTHLSGQDEVQPPRDEVDEVADRVRDALGERALRAGADVTALVAATGADPQQVSRALARLELAGRVHRDVTGWRRG